MANHDRERDFALCLPPVLLSVSPALASVHAARARRLYPEIDSLDSTFCRECKAYLQDGTGAHRTRRSGARSKRTQVTSRHLHVHCTVCGADNVLELPVDKESVSQFPMPRARARAVANSEALAPTHQQPVAEPSEPPPITSVPEHTPRSLQGPSRSSSATPRPASLAISTPAPPNRQGKAKNRPKNKSGLQELLARKKQADTTRTATPTNALSSFLSEIG